MIYHNTMDFNETAGKDITGRMKRLAEAVAASELTQEKFAAACGTSKQALNGWLKKGVEPMTRYMLAMKNNLGVSPDYILHGKGPMLVPRQDPIAAMQPPESSGYEMAMVGDSMEPAIPDGMTLIVETEQQPRHGDFVVVGGEDRPVVKRLIDDGGVWLLSSDNPRYPARPLGNTPLRGVVTAMYRRLRADERESPS